MTACVRVKNTFLEVEPPRADETEEPRRQRRCSSAECSQERSAAVASPRDCRRKPPTLLAAFLEDGEAFVPCSSRPLAADPTAVSFCTMTVDFPANPQEAPLGEQSPALAMQAFEHSTLPNHSLGASHGQSPTNCDSSRTSRTAASAVTTPSTNSCRSGGRVPPATPPPFGPPMFPDGSPFPPKVLEPACPRQVAPFAKPLAAVPPPPCAAAPRVGQTAREQLLPPPPCEAPVLPLTRPWLPALLPPARPPGAWQGPRSLPGSPSAASASASTSCSQSALPAPPELCWPYYCRLDLDLRRCRRDPTLDLPNRAQSISQATSAQVRVIFDSSSGQAAALTVSSGWGNRVGWWRAVAKVMDEFSSKDGPWTEVLTITVLSSSAWEELQGAIPHLPAPAIRLPLPMQPKAPPR
mmetsp:Transcript_21213/g.41482  ORF Transcript_21213/g.41482 Transcript_21213/m.41482 type:complete len:410 (+) Transcript_21213:134-1363(+)